MATYTRLLLLEICTHLWGGIIISSDVGALTTIRAHRLHTQPSRNRQHAPRINLVLTAAVESCLKASARSSEQAWVQQATSSVQIKQATLLGCCAQHMQVCCAPCQH